MTMEQVVSFQRDQKKVLCIIGMEDRLDMV